MRKYLVKFRADWADEFECQQFCIVDDILDMLGRIDEYIENGAYFGTNQYWEKGELDPGCVEIIELDEDEVATLKRCFGNYGFGTGPL